MHNYIISTNGTIRALGPATSRHPITSAPGVRPVVFGESFLVPPPQPLRGVALQQADPPTPEQIAAAVRKLSVPTSLPSWRVEAVLKIAGKYDAAMAIIDALPEPQRTITLTAWVKNEQVERHGALLNAALPVLGISDDEADTMFLQAASLTPN